MNFVFFNINDTKMNNYNLIEFAKFASLGYWKEAPHLKLIADNLEKLEARNIKRLIVNMPPRHGKSELISKYFPLWYMIKNPSHRIILTSYNTKFAEYWGGEIMNIIYDIGDELGVKISKNKHARGSFQIEGHKGSMQCVGAGGSLTGLGANLIIIDDPIKNNTEADSQIVRENLWDWLLSTVYTRLEPDGVIAIVMTRWHKDDICGRIIKKFMSNDDEKEIKTDENLDNKTQ